MDIIFGLIIIIVCVAGFAFIPDIVDGISSLISKLFKDKGE
jgi:predicted PurR-regulated permease PerM